MNDYTEHNIKVMKVALRDHAERVVKTRLLTMLRTVAAEMVKAIDEGFVMPDGSVQFPVWTANLHDATGVGVYADGTINYFVPTARAVKGQKSGYDRGLNGLPGSSLLHAAITEAGGGQFRSGIWIVIFSTVPYAYRINTDGSRRGRGAGFFEVLKSRLINDVIAGLKPINNE